MIIGEEPSQALTQEQPQRSRRAAVLLALRSGHAVFG
jgi:hypothetical protein